MDLWIKIGIGAVIDILEDKRLIQKHKPALMKIFALLSEALSANEQLAAMEKLAAKRGKA